MGSTEIILIGIGLAMDAFAVSICKGLSMKKINWKKAIIIALYFGIFQAIMPSIGYCFGTTCQGFVTKIDHWVAFALLSFIGANMIKESFSEQKENCNDKIDFKTMTVLALATSIDALTVGISFAFLKVNLLLAMCIIGIITFIISIIGVKIGNKFGKKYENKAEFVGGLILICIGIKMLIKHS